MQLFAGRIEEACMGGVGARSAGLAALSLIVVAMSSAGAAGASPGGSSPIYAGQSAEHAIGAAQAWVGAIAAALGGKHDLVTLAKVTKVLTNGTWTAKRGTVCGKPAWLVSARFSKAQKAANTAAIRKLEPGLKSASVGTNSSSPIPVTAKGVMTEFSC
jgi:hypothetical protein